MSDSDSPLTRYDRVLMRLSKSEAMGEVDPERALREITEAAAQTLEVARVNVWLYDEGRTKFSCIDHYDLASGEHSSGVELFAADFPKYFRVLDEERSIVANEAQSDPRTREFTKGYLDLHGITSMMDMPLHSRGKVIGIVCHEHIGPPRIWTTEEQQFAGSMADLATLALESSERRQAEDALVQSERRTRAILEHALDAIVTVDEASVITGWNPQAETVFGWSSQEAIGMTLFDTVIPARDHERHRIGVSRFLETGSGTIIDRRIEITARDKSGREFPIELTISPLRIEGSWMFSAFVRDITSRVRAELELHELNSNLEQRVHERTDQLKAAVLQKERLLEELKTSSLELARKLRELELSSGVIKKDLERAQTIQRALLPSVAPCLERVHLDALYRPGTNVGGDLYDVSCMEDGHIAIYVADATGHGVSAAMLSVLFKQRLEMNDEKGCALSPSDVLLRVNERLYGDVLTPGLFLTTAYALLDTNTLELRAASAGHTPMLLQRETGEIQMLQRTGPALGIDFAPAFTEHRLTLNPGDRLLLFTDGLIDGVTTPGTQGILDLILPALECEARDGPQRLRMLYQEAVQRAKACQNGEGADDVTLLMLEIASGPSHLDNDPGEQSEPLHELTPMAPAAPGQPAETERLWILEGEKETYLAIRGRGSWTIADSLRSLSISKRSLGSNLTIDLGECEYLDSTCLGALHEIVTLEASGQVCLRGPSESIRGLFRELGLEQVIASIDDSPLKAPAQARPVPRETPSQDSHRLLLRAHETLSDLSDENRSRFSAVVEMLRKELAEDD